YHTIGLSDSIFMGVGVRRIPGDLRNSLMMFFNIDGEELGFEQIYNDDITQGLSTNFIHDIARINDSLFLASSYFRYGSEPGQWGEMIIDTTGNIYQYEMRDQSTSGWTKMVKTFDNKYTIGCSWEEGNTKTDIYLYKINEDLEHDTIYPGNYTYDSLCPYQIQSGEIDISDCLIITDVGEIPTPSEYYASLNTIPIKAYPNPVNGGEITFEFENTEYHRNMELRCFNVFGELVHKEKVYQYQKASKVNINKWRNGIYFAIIYSNNQPVGQTKFLVQ
ncbi:MAG: T9SS type A sorting domain-containing protein, partial [Bacteroidales bacterium]|nr:T9SS type A sorting domain-containing protein [Bacteroidales bacterium]